MLITPYPTFWISFPFTLFFGTMWVIFVYVAWLIWRMRETGRSLAKLPICSSSAMSDALSGRSQ
jgi:hypothetical protein